MAELPAEALQDAPGASDVPQANCGGQEAGGGPHTVLETLEDIRREGRERRGKAEETQQGFRRRGRERRGKEIREKSGRATRKERNPREDADFKVRQGSARATRRQRENGGEKRKATRSLAKRRGKDEARQKGTKNWTG